MTKAALFDQLQEILEYIAGHARMARRHANERGWLASLQNVETAARKAIALLETTKATHPDDAITIGWSIEDVQEIRPDLTDQQAREVLSRCEEHFDANDGINWDVISDHAEALFPEP